MTAPLLTACQLTPSASGSIAIIEITGPGSESLLESIFTPRGDSLPALGQLALGLLHDQGQQIDEAILARTQAGWELNVHGGELVVRETLALLARRGCEIQPAPAVDPADPVGMLTSELREAVRHLTSLFAVRCLCNQWHAGLRTLVESALTNTTPQADALRDAAGRFDLARRLLHPPEVILAGKPNTGKSTLFNRLVGREVAITHARAGTTRDYLREVAHLLGRAVWLTDTAGLWDQATCLDAAGVTIAREQLSRADLVVLCSCDEPSVLPDTFSRPILRIATMADLHAPTAPFDLAISVETDTGLDALGDAILAATGLANIDQETPMAFTERQRDLLLLAADAIDAGDSPAAKESLQSILRG
jgi:tRNA modification GTPase